MDAALQAIPGKDQPAIAPVGSVFFELSPWLASSLIGIGQ
jgi:hypothetical protein